MLWLAVLTALTSFAAPVVLAPEADRLVERARLHPDVVTEHDVRELFVRTGDNDPALPSRGMLDDLVALADHPDVHVRRQLPEALWAWFVAHTQGPFGEGDDLAVDEAVLIKLMADRDVPVRKRTAKMLIDARPGLLTHEVGNALLKLSQDRNRGVRRVALAAIAEGPRLGIVAAPVAWMRAVDAVKYRKGDGRTACNTLGKLHRDVEPSEIIDPKLAVNLCLLHHPEHAWNVWTAWREEVPFEPNWADALLNDTIGYSATLANHWVDTRSDDFAVVLAHWQPTDPERFEMVRASLSGTKKSTIRQALGLAPIEPPEE